MGKHKPGQPKVLVDVDSESLQAKLIELNEAGHPILDVLPSMKTENNGKVKTSYVIMYWTNP